MFKRSLLGYRRADVDEVLASRDGALDDAGRRLIAARRIIDSREQVIVEQQAELQLAQIRIADLERIATTLSERVVQRERELKQMRAELSELHTSSEQGMKALVSVAAELDAIRGQARGQATRIRMQALSEAAELSDSLSTIAQRPLEVRERLVAALTDAISEVKSVERAAEGTDSGEDEQGFEPGPIVVFAAETAEDEIVTESEGEPLRDPISELAAEVEATTANDEGSAIIAVTNGAGPARKHVHPGDLFNGMVEVEIGPLDDFSQLVGFEDAASGIAGTSEIAVKRFAKGRATLEMRLDTPIELLRELEGRAPFEFSVRDTREDRVILDLNSE